MQKKYIVSYSGGIGSWATAKRIIEREGKENVQLVFTDTLMEDEDLYRFLYETVEKFGAEFVHLKEGRNVWEVFEDNNFLGNSQHDLCSRILKRELFRKWLYANYQPGECVICIGIDWSEFERFDKFRDAYNPYETEAPMLKWPFISKPDAFDMLEAEGIKPPRLYDMGFSHNNCGGFCIKAGQGHFKLLLEKMPERFEYHAKKELEIRERIGKDVTILRRTIKGESHKLTLYELKDMVQTKEKIDEEDIGGCACFI